MSRIHWLGAGLSSGPGIARLARKGYPMILWNRTLAKAQCALEGVEARNVRIEPLDFGALRPRLEPGDVVVSMLPAHMHLEVASACLAARAHLVTSSYRTPEMRELDADARASGLSFLGECGLDPGLDHLLALELVAAYRGSEEFAPKASLRFRSLCGGFPKHPGPFRYKFSWSPIGVLRALKTPAQYVHEGEVHRAAHPWKDLSTFQLFGETFETYPNRDSLPYIEEYGFEPTWRVDAFVRGTLRLEGWSAAWRRVFAEIENASSAELESSSQRLWESHAYGEGEEDRVVLYVGLSAESEGRSLFSRSYALDETGAGRDTAMARLVSLPVTFAAESILRGAALSGVSGVPTDRREVHRWLRGLQEESVAILDQDDRPASF